MVARLPAVPDPGSGPGASLTKCLVLAAQHVLLPTLALSLLGFALLYALPAVAGLIRPIAQTGALVEGLVKGLHMGVVALAVYELSQIIYQEYGTGNRPEDLVNRIRHGLTRFVSVACAALVLEALIAVIRYSHQGMVGFLLYPLTILISAAALLAALGLFTRLTLCPHDCD